MCGTSVAVNNRRRRNIYGQHPPCRTRGTAKIEDRIKQVVKELRARAVGAEEKRDDTQGSGRVKRLCVD